MAYCVHWRLVGLADRLLDSGRLDDDFEDYGAAVAAIDTFLRSYVEVGHQSEGGYWRARRSADADIEMQIWVDRMQDGPHVTECENASVASLVQSGG